MDVTESALLRRTWESPDDTDARLILADYYAENGRPEDEWTQRAVVASRPVLADPAADDPRLVFADFCDSHGRHERAAWIRAAVKLARLAHCPAWCDHDPIRCDRARLEKEIRKIADAGGPVVWTPKFGKWQTVPVCMVSTAGDRGGAAGVSRGFIHRVRCPADLWLKNAHDLLLQHPVERAYLTSLPKIDTSDWSRVSQAGSVCRLAGNRPDGTDYPVRSVSSSGFRERPLGVAVAIELLTAEFPGVEFLF